MNQTRYNKRLQKNFIVNSNERLSITSSGLPPNSSQFTCQLFNDNGYKGIEKISLLYAVIPNSIYNIRSGVNDKLVFAYNSVGNTFTVTIPAGNYTASSLFTEIQTLMNTAIGSNVITIAFSTTYNNTVNFGSSGSNLYLLLGQWNGSLSVLGFSGSSTLGPSTSITAPNSINLTFPNYIYITFQEIKEGYTTTDTTLKDRPCFVIPIDVNSGDVITFQNTSYFQQCIEMNHSTLQLTNTITVSLNFPGGEPVNLNGLDWSMILHIQYLE